MKLTKITLKDFRGFPYEESFNLPDGKNLLLHGENGSGKSSIYRALVEFLNQGKDAAPFWKLRNLFAAGIEKSFVDGHVTLSLQDGSKHEWRCLGQRPNSDANLPQLTREWWANAAQRASLLEYRSLLRMHYGNKAIQEQLFDLAVTTLIANIPVVGIGGKEKSVALLWKELQESKPYRHSKWQLRRVAEAEKAFNEGVRGILPDVQKRAEELLGYFAGVGLKLHFGLPGVRYNGRPRSTRDRKFENKVLEFEVKLHEVVLPEWNDLLNEARLSALAISLYLAGVSMSNPVVPSGVAPPLKLLVLDDVLIGLDLSNRLPVLRILEERFADFQVLLFTHDRVWYDMAQLAFKNPENWICYEMHSKEIREGDFVFDAPVLKPQIGNLAEYFLKEAEEHLNVQHDTRTAALHTRVALEVKLKSYCSDKRVNVAYDLDGRHLDTEHFLSAIERRLNWSGTLNLALFHLQKIRLFRAGVLNPLAHFHPVSLARGEVATAIEAVRNLSFPKENRDFAKETDRILGKNSLSSEEVIDAACYLRTAFEVDVRYLLKARGGKVEFRDDWSKISLSELWEAAKVTMHRVNPIAATLLIAEIESHSSVYLRDWGYAEVSRFTKTNLDAAWLILRVPPPSVAKTRLSTFF